MTLSHRTELLSIVMSNQTRQDYMLWFSIIYVYISSIPYYWGCMHTDGKAYKMYSRNKSEPFSMISCFIVVSCPNVDWKPNIMLPQWGGQSHPWLHNAFNIGCHLFGFICYYSLNILYQSCGCNLNISYHICTHVHQSQF